MTNNKQKKQSRRPKSRSSSPNNRKHHSNSKSNNNSNSNGSSKSNSNDMFYNIMKGAAGTLASAATSTLGKDDGDKTSSGNSGDFDLYLLAMSWAPRFCCTNNKQCKNENMENTDDLSVHGLWSNNINIINNISLIIS